VALALTLLAPVSAARAQGEPGVPSGPTPVSEGGAARRMTRAPALVAFVEAAFPPGEARSADVELALTIGATGRVREVSVLRSAGAAFDEAAVRAAREFVFTPAEVNGRPAAVKIRYTYSFTYTPAPSPLPTAREAPPEAPAPPPPSPSAPQEIVIRGVRRTGEIAATTIAARQAKRVAGTQGDPIKVLENLPGLARPSFGSGQLLVWGSAPEDTRTYVDGVEVPALFHGSALRSTVNGDLVESVTLMPGAYGAEYGRSLGGVVKVETRDLPETGVHGYAGVDTLDGSALASAALGERLRVAVAGRYGWLDRVLQAVDAPNVGDYFAIPRYGDYQAKAQLRLRPGESLDLGFLGSSDDLTQTIPDADPSRVRSESTSSTFQRVYLRYRRRDDAAGAVEVLPWFGHDARTLDAHFGDTPASLDVGTWRGGVRASSRSRLGERVAVVMGADVDVASARISRAGSLEIPPREGDISVFGQPPGNDSTYDRWRSTVVSVAPYLTSDLALGPLSLSPGLRLDGFLVEASRKTPRVGQTPSIGATQLQAKVAPRVSGRLRVGPHLSLLAAAGVYSQPPDPADLSAVFGNPTLGPSSAIHGSFGEALRITPSLSLEVVVFYKWMSDLAVRDPSPTPKLAAALLQEGVGRSYGVQMLLRQQLWRGFFGWAAYTISRSERRDTPDSAWRLFDYDQPHVLTLVASQELGAWTFGARFRYAEGLPRTPVTGAFYDAKDDGYQPIFGPQNSARLPAFWQIDLRVDRSFLVGDARVLVYLEGLNVTNHANGEEYVYNADYSRRGTVTGLPIVGVLGARVEL
jgi:TonB family protein